MRRRGKRGETLYPSPTGKFLFLVPRILRASTPADWGERETKNPLGTVPRSTPKLNELPFTVKETTVSCPGLSDEWVKQ